uniref:Putative second mitotic wave missing n=1 Tax=Corethrella appendiculata TaxID=1370023 RepID=U5EPT6_9DIPT
MHINNPDTLKVWLSDVLEPLCDADPSALARYILALLKKDKPIKELQDCMKEQLDVFLSGETEPFLERLFNVLKTEEYLKSVSPNVENSENTLAVATTTATTGDESELINDDKQQAPTIGILPATTGSTAATINSSSSSTNESTPSTIITANKIKIKRECTPPITETKSKEYLEKNGDTDSSSSTFALSLSGSANSSNSSCVTHTNIVSPAATNRIRQEPSPIRISTKADHVKNKRRRISNRSRSRTRSRSRSFERIRRSRSRERIRNSDVGGRDKPARNQYRNKSPPFGIRRYERKNVYNNSRIINNNNNNINRNNRSQSGSRSPSPAPMSERRKMARSESPTTATTTIYEMSAAKVGASLGIGGGSGGSSVKRQRCRDFDEKGYCMRGETCPWDHGIDPVVLEDINNPALISIQSTSQIRGPIHPEYNPDAPDLWTRGNANFPPVRGSLAHRLGAAPVSASGLPAGQFGLRSAQQINFRSAAPFVPTFGPGGAPIGTLQRELISVPVVDANKGGDVSALQPKRRFEPEDTVAVAEGPNKRKLQLNSRLGPRVSHGVGGNPAISGAPQIPQQNCSLELRKIPRGLNAIAHLNNHFSKFGKIVNIQISYDGDPEAAIVTFSTHAEANVAYRSTEAVLNNRFIKVFWHTGSSASGNVGAEQSSIITPTSKTENPMTFKRNQYSINHLQQPTTTAAPPIATTTESTNIPVTSQSTTSSSSISTSSHQSSNTTTTAPIISSATKLVNTITTPASATSSPATQSNVIATPNHLRVKTQRRTTNELIRKKQEEHVKTAVQLAQGLNKKKHELIQEYFKQLHSAVALVEKTEHNDPQRTNLLATIKTLESSIAKLKEEMKVEQTKLVAQVQTTTGGGKKTKEQTQKELLDVELELITQEQHGGASAPDTLAMQKRLNELQRTLHHGSSKPSPVTYITTPNTVVRNIVRAPVNNATTGAAALAASVKPQRLAPPGSTSVDRRPKSLQILGFQIEDADSLLGHFKHFGEITKHQLDKNVPSLIVSYTTRSNAEQAAARGKLFKDKQLTITWAVPNTNNNNNSNHQKLESISSSESVSDNNLTSETCSTDDTEIRMDEEEEEEDIESEDRSWRR